MKRIYLSILFLFTISLCAFAQNIQIHYLGHSAFVYEFDEISVVSDYGKPNAWKKWGWDSPIHGIGDLKPDIMAYSHLHDDHYDSTRIPEGVKHILKKGEKLDYKNLKMRPIKTCEDNFGDFGNTSYLFSYKGYNILHTGDIQVMISEIENDKIATYFKDNFPKQIDVLIMPIEGKAKYIPQTERFIRLLNPEIVIPSHQWSREYMDEFVLYLKNFGYSVNELKGSKFKLSQLSGNKPEIIVLQRASY